MCLVTGMNQLQLFPILQPDKGSYSYERLISLAWAMYPPLVKEGQGPVKAIFPMKPCTRVIKGLGPAERDMEAARQKLQECLPRTAGSLELPKLGRRAFPGEAKA